MPGERIELDEFLGGLSDEAAAQARVAAAKIDRLEQTTDAYRGVEAKYTAPFLVSVILFVAAIVLLFDVGGLFADMRNILGGLGLTAMAAALPISAVVYVFHVRGRTRADREKMDLNRAHFIPHGGIYFSRGDSGDGTVYIAEMKGLDPRELAKAEKYKPGRIW